MKQSKIATRSPIQGGVGLGSAQSSRLTRAHTNDFFLVCVSTLQSQLFALLDKQESKNRLVTVRSSLFVYFILFTVCRLRHVNVHSFHTHGEEEGVRPFHISLCLRHRFSPSSWILSHEFDVLPRTLISCGSRRTFAPGGLFTSLRLPLRADLAV